VIRKMILIVVIVTFLVACRQEEAPAIQNNSQSVTTDQAAGDSESIETSGSSTSSVATPEADEGQTPNPTPTTIPTPVPPKELIVCVSGEPQDLYLYGDSSAPAVAIRHALYESLYTSLGYDYQPLALEKLPSLADGDAILESVAVEAGMLVINSAEEIVPLAVGTEVIDVNGEVQIFTGEPIPMPQLVVDYTFKPLVWSDGTPVTAEDSVFSYELAGDRETPRLDDQVRYSASYTAVDERTVRWVGLPGYLDPTFMTHIWTPLPRHQLEEFTPAELPDISEAAIEPLSYGPFVVESWTPGEEIRLSPNPHYYRSAEGLPYLDALIFRFLSSGNTRLPDGFETCDIITQDVFSFDALPAVDEAQEAGTLVEHVATAGVIEQIIFGIDPVPSHANTRPDWFSDARVRQAITQCIDRQAIVDELTYGRAGVMHTFVPLAHSMHPAEQTEWSYDPGQANAVLDELGYLDSDGDGIRNAIGSTQTFLITLGTNTESALRQQINERVRDDLRACSIEVELYSMDAGAWFAPGPSGAVFGRRFDLAQFAWLSRIEPNCGLYQTVNIPGAEAAGYRGWGGVNVSGWSNEEFDAACGTALSLLPGQPGYIEAHQEALRVFAQELPAVPLFTRLRLAATSPSVLNFALDPSQPSELWNAFELDLDTGGS
jgi:peptide/nickel transport system substrate-binding protein